MSRAANVHFEIDRLTLEGFSVDQRRRFVGSLRDGLTAAGADPAIDWWAAASRPLGRIDAALRPGASPEAAAARVVATILASVREGGRR